MEIVMAFVILFGIGEEINRVEMEAEMMDEVIMAEIQDTEAYLYNRIYAEHDPHHAKIDELQKQVAELQKQISAMN